MTDTNLLRPLVAPETDEVVEPLFSGGAFRVERIVSTGQITPPGAWYDQDEDEWVVLLSGAARLLFEDETSDRELVVGDAVHIAAHRKHRVTWTDPERETVWLAVHYSPADEGDG